MADVDSLSLIECDIAVVGAGPAGAVFSRELAKKRPDLKMVLINGQSVDRQKPCGGLLAPDAQKALARFNLTLPKAILSDPQIFAVQTIDLGTGRVRYYQRHYLNMNRFEFDSWLVSLVPDTVERLEGRCERIVEKDGGYVLTVYTHSKKLMISAKSIVGADGASSVVRRSFFKVRLKQYVSIQQWFENKGQQLPYYSCIFDKKTGDSCSWTIHKDNYVIYGGAFEKKNCKEAYEEQKRRLESFIGDKFGNAIRTEACLVSSPRSMRDFTVGKPGVYLIGEAAGFISSSSFEGMSSAILSGKYLQEAFCSGKDKNDVLKLYKRKTLRLRIKLCLKNPKRFVICNQVLRNLVMKIGIQSVKKYI